MPSTVSTTRRRVARLRRNTCAAAGLVLGVLLLSGCQDDPVLGSGTAESQSVLASQTYAANAGAERQQARVAELREVVADLRSRTSGGWQARQDDVTGYASELSGGRWSGPVEPEEAARTFLAGYGRAFGLASATDVGPVDAPAYDEAGVSDVRMQQTHRGVPVEGSSLLVPVTRRGEVGEVTLARGRAFDVAEVETTPAVQAAQAAEAVEAFAGAPAQEAPVLVVLPDLAAPRLAWRAPVIPPPAQEGALGLSEPSKVFVDAQTGEVLDARPLGTDPSLARVVTPASTPDLGKYDFDLPPAGKPVKVRGTLSDGTKVEVNAEQQPDGSIVMVDATGPEADRATKKGLIVLFDGSGVKGDSNSLGEVLRVPSAADVDLDAVSAMWGARQVMDYYAEEMGRLSFDGRNSPLLISLRYTEGQRCLDNAFFATYPGESRMALGVPCVEGGKPSSRTFADLSIVVHEITHGVTATNAPDFGFNVQQGSIHEGNGDYFGVVVENAVRGEVGTTGSHYACAGGLENDSFCQPLTDGQRGLRDINSGATYDDLLFTLNDPRSITQFTGDDGHANSMVWTNALWDSRTAVAQRDGGDLVRSAKAKAFDRAVYRAITTYLDPTTDLISASESVVRAMGEVDGLDAKDQELVRRQMRLSKLCRQCVFPERISRYVSVSTKTKTRPQVTSSGVAFTQYEGQLSARGLVGKPGGESLVALDAGDGLVLNIAAKGNAVVSTVVTFAPDGKETISLVQRDLSTGAGTTLSTKGAPFIAPATDGASAAWVEEDGQGRPSLLRIRPVAGGEGVTLQLTKPVAHLALSGDRLAVHHEDGELVVRDIASGQQRRLAQLAEPVQEGVQKPVGGLSFDGDRLAVLDFTGLRSRLLVFDLAAGTTTQVTDSASPFGLALDGDLVVWPHVVGPITGKVAQLAGRPYPDTQLWAYSFGTGRFYEMVNQRGQQGFPSLDGRVLAWQDTVGGSDDIFATTIPEGL